MPNIKLRASDDEIIEMDVEVAKCSETIKTMLDLGVEIVPLPDVESAILMKVIEWATHHKDDPPAPEVDENQEGRNFHISPWDSEFLDVDMDTLYELSLAADFLRIQPLMDLTFNYVAYIIMGKTPEEIRDILNEADSSPPSSPDEPRASMPIVKLQASDNEVLEVDVAVAKCSLLINKFLQDLGDERDVDEVMPLPNVTSAILKKVIEWATYHKDDPPAPEDDEDQERRTDDISPWDSNFLNLEMSTLFDLIIAAGYLEIKGLEDVACKQVAKMNKEKTLRKMFNIQNPFQE